MSNEKKTEKVADKSDTTKRVSTGFWAIVDEFKDDTFKLVRTLFPFGLAAPFVLPLVFTAEGRAVLEESADYLGMKYGDQTKAKVYDWSMRAYHLLRNTILVMLGVLVALGLAAILSMTDRPEVADRLPFMLINVLTVSVVLLAGFARLAPLVAAVGAGAGALSSIADKDLSWGLLKSLPAFLSSGGKTGVMWMDNWWRIINRTLMFYAIGAPWLALIPIHNDPAMKYVVGLLIPPIFYTHMAYKPGDRGPFWWWANWMTAFAVADITLWCMFPALKLVYNLGVDQQYLKMIAAKHPQFLEMYIWFGQNDWFRVGATLVGVAFLGVQIWWTIKLARGSSQVKTTGRGGVYSSGGVIYTAAPKFQQGGIAGKVILALFAMWVLSLVFRNEMDISHRPNKVVQNELGRLNLWLPGFNPQPITEENGQTVFRPFVTQPPVIEGDGRFADTPLDVQRLGSNPDSFQVTLNARTGGWQTIPRAVNRGDVINYVFLDRFYSGDSLGSTIRVGVDGFRVNGRTFMPTESPVAERYVLTRNAPYGSIAMVIGDGRPQATQYPSGELTLTKRILPVEAQQIKLGFNLAQYPEAINDVSGQIRVVVWITRA